MAIDINHSDHDVVVALTGFDRIFGLKARLDIPASRIASVTVMPRRDVPPTPGTWLRKPGTHIPGLIRYGSYGTEPNREFWAVYRQPEVLVIAVDGWAYSRVVLGTNDPNATAESLSG